MVDEVDRASLRRVMVGTVLFVRLGCMVTNIKGDVIFARDLARKSLGFQGFIGCLSGIRWVVCSSFIG